MVTLVTTADLDLALRQVHDNLTLDIQTLQTQFKDLEARNEEQTSECKEQWETLTTSLKADIRQLQEDSQRHAGQMDISAPSLVLYVKEETDDESSATKNMGEDIETLLVVSLILHMLPSMLLQLYLEIVLVFLD